MVFGNVVMVMHLWLGWRVGVNKEKVCEGDNEGDTEG